MPNFNSIGTGVSEPQVAGNPLPLTGGIALTTVYALTCYTVTESGTYTCLYLAVYNDLSMPLMVHILGVLESASRASHSAVESHCYLVQYFRQRCKTRD